MADTLLGRRLAGGRRSAHFYVFRPRALAFRAQQETVLPLITADIAEPLHVVYLDALAVWAQQKRVLHLFLVKVVGICFWGCHPLLGEGEVLVVSLRRTQGRVATTAAPQIVARKVHFSSPEWKGLVQLVKVLKIKLHFKS